jgi:hypothetical protein
VIGDEVRAGSLDVVVSLELDELEEVELDDVVSVELLEVIPTDELVVDELVVDELVVDELVVDAAAEQGVVGLAVAQEHKAEADARTSKGAVQLARTHPIADA